MDGQVEGEFLGAAGAAAEDVEDREVEGVCAVREKGEDVVAEGVADGELGEV